MYRTILLLIFMGGFAWSEDTLPAAEPEPENVLIASSDTKTLPTEPDYLNTWLNEIPDHTSDLATHYENLYRTTQASYITRSLERAQPYQDLIFQVLDELKAPRELFYLPIIESAFTNTATSRVGAAGMWQFMPRSATPYDMDVNTWLDERRDFLKSTRGAIKKLMDEYAILQDWHLTLAAYNCGVARIQNIWRRYGKITFWEMSERRLLPRETIHYVPKFLASVRVASQPGRMNFPISWEPNTQWAVVTINHQADIRLLARTAGVDYNMLRAFNRELRYSVTPQGEYDLKVPLEWEEKIRKALEDPELTRMRFTLHRIRRGDTLSELSRQFSVEVSMIQRYNPGLQPTRLRLNQTLIIPQLGAISGQPLAVSRPASTYRVRSGDNLWNLSRRWNTTVEAIRLANSLPHNSVLRIGQTLRIPSSRRSEA